MMTLFVLFWLACAYGVCKVWWKEFDYIDLFIIVMSLITGPFPLLVWGWSTIEWKKK